MRCRVAGDLINKGQYEPARDALGDLWQGIDRRPSVEGLEERTVAEALLQAGALSGWLGASQQVQGAQGEAKDLIGGTVALLAEALTTQGVAWARLGKNEESINVIRRAMKVAEDAGASCNAGLAALTLIEEHGARRVLSHEELYEVYRRADRLLKETQHAEIVARLRVCARIVMRRMAGTQFGDNNFTLFKAVHELEAKFIGQALDEADGSVTRAAKVLGISHQTFLSMLNTRHRKLLEKRKPREKRLRSIMTPKK